MAGPLLAYFAGCKPVRVSASFRHKVLTLGSVLHEVRPSDVVWGTGAIRSEPVRLPRNAVVLAVRGPLTRKLLSEDVPEVYGDPALLLPLMLTDTIEPTYRVGVVPHYVDREHIGVENDPAVCVIDVRRPWPEVVRHIRHCEAIVSTSLHGVVVAEAFGIPASWVVASTDISGGHFKFHDYLLATGRETLQPTEWSSGLSTCVSRTLPPMSYDRKPLLDSAAGVLDVWSRR